MSLKNFLYKLSRNGRFGEWLTHISALNFPGYKKVVSHIYCVTNNTVPTEIDSVMVTRFGLVVIETKHFSGTLIGHYDKDQWTLQFKHHKRNLYSPIRQNQTHIYALNKALPQYKHVPKFSLIVVDEACTLQVTADENNRVVHRWQLNKPLKLWLNTQPMVLSRKEVREIADQLRKMRYISRKNKKTHMRHVQSKKQSD
ncbi:MAG: hypothetical protein CVU85_00410 [Firmicutes bacterium HGW-Firmicutes-10]|nr:MAG: hypothetical protein CVU85_00410 [Firmicutes bacterium HGW-Firmicutes-10]